MSAATAIRMGSPRTSPAVPATSPTRFRVVATREQRHARPRVFYAVVTMSVIFGIIVAQLLLSVAVSSGAYEISGLQAQNRELTRTHQSMSQDLDRLASPQNLAANAEALGMVNNNTPVYLRLSDGAVLGSPEAASAGAGVIGGGTLVANSLLSNVPLVTTIAAASQTAPGATGAGASVPSPVVATGPVPLQNGLPGMSTH
ncbi:MAG: hypothetical protein JJE28_09215 [Actinomycetales bacterium]|nr:hypothetical protein [Actinomycetales bacterium]